MLVDSKAARMQWGNAGGKDTPMESLSGLLRGSTEGSEERSWTSFWKKAMGTDDVNQGEGENLEEGQGLKEGNESSISSSFWPTKEQFQSGAGSIRNWNKRFKGFVVFMLLGLLFMAMASFFLPWLLIRPAKFALSFTFGSFSFMGAFAMLKGPHKYFRSLVDPKYIVFTTAYIVSLVLTLYSSLILGSYLLVIVSSIVQVVALMWYGVSAIPGGPSRLKTFFSLFFRTSKAVVKSCLKLLCK